MKPCPLAEKCESYRRLMKYGPFSVRKEGWPIWLIVFAFGMVAGALLARLL